MATEKNSAVKNKITAIESTQGKDALDVTLKGTNTPNYTVYELFKPARIVVDVADTTLAKSTVLELPKESQIKLTTSAITDTKPPLTRFTFTLPESRQFSVVQKVNDIVLNISKGQDVPAKTKNAPKGEKKVTAIAISDINVVTTPKETIVKLLATEKVTSYHYGVLEKKGDIPPRLYIDVNNVTGDTLVKEHHVGTALADIRVAKRGTGLRFVLDSSTDPLFPFQVAPLANGIEIRIQETAQKADKQDAVGNIIKQKQMIESQLPVVDASQQNAEAINAKSVASSMQDAFNFSGYDKERITVDFYKIDLHNVFRLIREVSKMNIIVDDSVSGSLTLTLDDVPWDFALDIILNLKDLQKEERFNTIVIHPKDKKFNWPKRAEDNLSFEADETVTEQEAILINQLQNIPESVVQAKQLISKAQHHEKREEIETAITFYQKALDKWPDNAQLSNKIASLYLVQLRQNAKAAFYAKKSLKIEPKNYNAALTAAIAFANMKETKTAQQFFNQATSTKQPSSEALLSYSAFSEQQQQYAGALKILNKYKKLYGENLTSMVSEGRILDKMGKHEDATKAYKTILLSGYRIPPDLKKYIKGRVALSPSM